MAERERSSDSGDGGGGLADALRRYVDAVVGVTEVSRKRAEEIIRELAERGETRTKDVQKAARELADRSARNQRDLARLIQKEVRRQIEALGLSTRGDVEGQQDVADRADEAPDPPREKGKKKSAPARKAKPSTARKPRSASTE